MLRPPDANVLTPVIVELAYCTHSVWTNRFLFSSTVKITDGLAVPGLLLAPRGV